MCEHQMYKIKNIQAAGKLHTGANCPFWAKQESASQARGAESWLHLNYRFSYTFSADHRVKSQHQQLGHSNLPHLNYFMYVMRDSHIFTHTHAYNHKFPQTGPASYPLRSPTSMQSAGRKLCQPLSVVFLLPKMWRYI